MESVLFHVEPLPRFHCHSVDVLCRGQTRTRRVDLDDPQERRRFLTSVWKKRLRPTTDRKKGMRQLDAALDVAIESMQLRQGRPILQRMDDVRSAEVRWLWPGKIPAGKLTMLIGDPGLGKSLLALDIAARVSQGDPWPDDPPHAPLRKPADVLLLSAEDDASDTLRPRLEAHGANLRRITLLEGCEKSQGLTRERVRFSLVDMLDKLEQSIESVDDCRLVVVDPISAYLQGIDANRNADVRALLAPLTQLAQKYRVAVLAVNHLNKNLGGPLIYRSLGSLAFAAAARAVWAIVRDPRDRERRIIFPVKNNLASDSRALAFRLEPCDQFGTAQIRWETKPLVMDNPAALLGNYPASRTPLLLRPRMIAMQWLRRQLTSGQRASNELLATARHENIAEKTLRRAFHELGGTARKAPAGHWVWMLPSPPPVEKAMAPPAEVALQSLPPPDNRKKWPS
ncbi:MAG: AAA family ATPase [Planctomycetes bacterium]|nr:AAA family ATPase [Planctomycetota bacterium]